MLFQQLKTRAPDEFIQKCLGLWPIKVMCCPKNNLGIKKKNFLEKQGLRNSYKGDFNGK